MDRPKRVAGIDLGKARVGLAVSDELGLYAHPRPYVDGHNRKALLAELARVAREERLQRFVVGLPLELSGAQGVAAMRAIEFAQQLANATGVEVELLDERLTTVEAEHQLEASGVSRRAGRSRVDGVAAAVLLQSWLDAGADESRSDAYADAYADADESRSDADADAYADADEARSDADADD